MTQKNEDRLVEAGRDRYGKIATGEISGCAGAAAVTGCCGSAEGVVSMAVGYGAEDLAVIPEGSNLGLGCGAPIPVLDLQPGETVLDLGSGAGIDAFLAARRVGPTGHVIGVDMTPEMIAKARHNAVEVGLPNVEFREGRLERLPVDDASVDAVTSNCVINLVPDKAAVFGEIARVLRPGGRVVVSDIVLDGPLPVAIANDVFAYVGCVSGALPRAEYFALLDAAGLADVTVHKDLDYLNSAGYAMPPEIRDAMAAAGIRDEDLAGVIRSVTYRAVRR